MAEKLTLETFVRAYVDYVRDERDRRRDENITYLFPDSFWTKVKSAYNKPESRYAAEDREWLESQIKGQAYSKSVRDVILLIKGLDGYELQEAMRILDFVNGIYSDENRNKNIEIFINKVTQFKDQDVAYQAIKYIDRGTISKCDLQTRKYIAYLLANSKSAVLEDIYNIIQFCETPDELRQVFNAICTMADKKLTAELQREIPDSSEIQRIVWYPKNAAETMYHQRQGLSKTLQAYLNDMPHHEYEKLNIEFRKYYEMTCDKYDTKKILMAQDPKYVQQFDESVITQITNVSKQNEELRQANQRLVSSEKYATSELEKLQAEIKTLTEKLEAERTKRESAEKGKRLLKSQLNALVMAAQQVRGGLGARGMTELRDAIDKITTREI